MSEGSSRVQGRALAVTPERCMPTIRCEAGVERLSRVACCICWAVRLLQLGCRRRNAMQRDVICIARVFKNVHVAYDPTDERRVYGDELRRLAKNDVLGCMYTHDPAS
jgi:hypothetical protein